MCPGSTPKIFKVTNFKSAEQKKPRIAAGLFDLSVAPSSRLPGGESLGASKKLP
jgi:hypothetical protein